MKIPKYIWIPLAVVAVSWTIWHFVINSEDRKAAKMEREIGPLPEK